MLREMTTRYGKTPGGYLWAVMEPAGMIIFLAFGFSLLLRSPSLGTSFLLFYATGFLPYLLFQHTAGRVMSALNYSRNLLLYPAVKWIDAVIARAVLNILTDLLVAYILMTAILYFVDNRTVLDFGDILLSFSLAALLGVGVGLMNCAINGFFPVWSTIWGIITRPLFLASAILYIYSDLPPLAQDVLWYNPLVHVTGLARAGYYPTYEPQYVSVVFMAAPGLILTFLGLLLLRRHSMTIVNRR